MVSFCGRARTRDAPSTGIPGNHRLQTCCPCPTFTVHGGVPAAHAHRRHGGLVANGRVHALSTIALLFGSTLGAQPAPRKQSCVTVVSASDRRPLSGARTSLADSSASGPVVVTDASGRACLGDRDSLALQIDAVGYLPVNLTRGATAAPQVLVQPMPDGLMLQAWGGRQILAALTQALHRPEITRDSIRASGIASVLLAAQSAELQSTVSEDSTGVLVLAYVDLAPGGSRYSEVRLKYNRTPSIVLGVTTTRCGDACSRENDLAIAWAARQGGGWNPDFMALKDSNGVVTRVALDASTDASAPDSVTAPRSVTVRGVVRSNKGALLPGIDVYTADGASWTVTDARGEYQLAVPMPSGGALITTRRLGWAPAFRIVNGRTPEPLEWNPVLKSTTVLATQFVRAAGLPEALKSTRYDDFLARRARGVGQFFMAEEIWSSVSLGDVLNHARGINARMTSGSNITSISVPSCPKSQALSWIGVFVDGVDQTSMGTLGTAPEANMRGVNAAESVLARYVSAAIVGMEIYIGRTQMPGEFADPRYCAVIALWTR